MTGKVLFSLNHIRMMSIKREHLADNQRRKLLIKNLQYLPKCLVLQKQNGGCSSAG